ncbi:MAG: rhodanese-like domain-containing protein [Acidimicrobiia bacterium]|nr:rhodanese-like domain-containing protein [Acidimicrobiia bacterium]
MTQIPEITIDDVDGLLAEGYLLLDVREDDEWAAGHAEVAISIPLSELVERRDELDTSAQILVTCKAGGRSLKATEALRSWGYDATNLAGGMLAWAGADRPMIATEGDAYVL